MPVIKSFVLAAVSLLVWESLSFAEMTVMSLQERMRQADTIVIGEIQEVHQTDAGAGGQPPLPTENWLATCRVDRYIKAQIHNPNVEEGKKVSLISIAFVQMPRQKPVPVKLSQDKRYLLFLKETGAPNEYEMITPYHGAFEAGQDYFIHDEPNPAYPQAVKMSFEEVVRHVTPQNK